eukprot:715754-Amphidinium_carterae.1
MSQLCSSDTSKRQTKSVQLHIVLRACAHADSRAHTDIAPNGTLVCAQRTWQEYSVCKDMQFNYHCWCCCAILWKHEPRSEIPLKHQSELLAKEDRKT